MEKYNKIMEVLVIVCFIAGMIASFSNLGLAFVLWAVPAGWGSGDALFQIFSKDGRWNK